MANIVIKKRVELGFLGEEYADSYVVFKKMSVERYSKFKTDALKTNTDIAKAEPGDSEEVKKQKTQANLDANASSEKLMMDLIKEQFHEGQFQGEKIEVADLSKFDPESIYKFFQELTGQVPDEEGKLAVDPKEPKPSDNQSKTETETPTS